MEEIKFGLEFREFVLYSSIVSVTLVGTSLALSRRLKSDVPGAVQNAIEALVDVLRKPVEEHFDPVVTDKVLPVLGSFFLFILVANLLGVVPLGKPPTADLSTTLALSVSAVASFQVMSVAVHGGRGALRQFALKPVPVIGPIVKLIDNSVRVVSLAIRLFGNLAGEHLVFEIVSGIVPLVLPVILMLLGVLVGGIQAVVFSMLALNYLAEELGAHEEAEEAEEEKEICIPSPAD